MQEKEIAQDHVPFFSVIDDHTLERITLSLQATYRECLLPLTINPKRIAAVPVSPTSNIGADTKENLENRLSQSPMIVDDKLYSYGIKTVFLRGRSCVLVRLKHCFQYCNAIEKDRSLRRE